MFQSIEPLALIVLSSLFLLCKKRLGSVLSVPYHVYFMCALWLMGGSFFVLVIGIEISAHQTSLAMSWINMTYVLQAAGEVFIGPIGLAMLSEYIPRKHLGLFMGSWVLASALANFIAAKIGSFTALPEVQSHQWLSDVVGQYALAFSLMGAFGMGAAGLLKWYVKTRNVY